MELTVKQVERMQYRKERLMEKTRRLEFLLSGRGGSILPLVRTKSGRHSEKRTWALVDELLIALERAEKYCRRQGEADLSVDEIAYQLPKGRRALCRSFLYCAIRIADSDPDWFWGWQGNFDEILRLAETTARHLDKKQLYLDAYFRPSSDEETDDFFAVMDYLYEAFSGQKIVDTFPEEDHRRYREARETIQRETEDAAAEYYDDLHMTAAEYDRIMAEHYSEAADSDNWDDADERVLQAGRQRKIDAWVKTFPNKETLCQQYLEFRRLFYQEEGWRLPRQIEQMLDFHLFARGESSFLRDDTFFYAYALLSKVLKQVQDQVEMEEG